MPWKRQALLDLVARDPGQAAARERLAALAREAGNVQEAERLHREKAGLDDAQDAFRKILLSGDDLSAHAAELSRLTGLLGRRFESRAWSILEKRTAPTQAPVGIDPLAGAPAETASGSMLADLLRALRSASASPRQTGGEPFGPLPQFVDAAKRAHLAAFTYDNGQTWLHLLPETMSGGVALLDYDGDGWLDLYAVQGGPIDVDASDPRAGADRLFRNNGDGTFADVTERAGLAKFARGYGVGAAVGDIDNDGDPDVLVSRLRAYALYANNGDGTFADVTAAWGLAGLRDNPTSAAFADLDNDGDLDLYVCHYMVYDPAHPRTCKTEKGAYFYCDPSRVDPAPDHVFRNDGGRFVDVTREAGFTDPGGRGLGVVAADIDDDGLIDLYVANDGTANYLFHNRGGFRFEEIGHAAGAAASAEGGYKAGMGVACADFDGDGLPELFVTNFYGEGTTLYQNLGGGLFTDGSSVAGLRTATRYVLGFGIAALDANNDGCLDLMITNGHVNDNRPYYPYAMPAQLFTGDGKGRLREVSGQAGPCWKTLRVGRGLAAGDLDNDGRLDAVIVSQNDPLAYFHNQTPKAGHFVTFALRGTRANRDGVGARLTVVAGGRRQFAQRTGGGSYVSASDPRLHFGLGVATHVDWVEVRWPSGRVDRYAELAADRGYVLRESVDQVQPLAGFDRMKR